MQKTKNIIGKKLLIRVLQVSTCITVVFTVISFYLDYEEEKKVLSDSRRQIQLKLMDNLSMSVYNFDQTAIQIQVDSLMSSPEIIAVSVLDEWGTELNNPPTDSKDEKYLETWEFELKKPDKNEARRQFLGVMKVLVTKKYMYARIARKMGYFFLSQGMKTLIVSLILLWIFNRLIVRHLLNIASNLQEFRMVDYKKYQPVSLFIKNHDELTRLNDVLNELCILVSEKLKDAHKEILLQKANAINSAKLASIGEMAGGIAHEINNPLAVIDGSVQLLRRGIDGHEVMSKSMLIRRCESIEEMVQRISTIVKGLRYFARDASFDSFEDAKSSLLVQDSVALCREKFRSFGIKIEVLKNPDLPLQCKAVQVGQVFLNILNNAFDALQGVQNPRLCIEVKEQDNYVDFLLKNNGPFVPHELKEKIMEPFVTTKDVGKGTGLGLSISLGIVESHGGTIFVEEEDIWTVFRVRLPKIQPKVEQRSMVA